METTLENKTGTLKPLEKKKTDFVQKAGRREISTPRANRVKRGDDGTVTPVKLFFFGEVGSGKTFVIVGLLLLGFKVCVITTDVGGSGCNTVKLYLRRIGKTELLANLYEVELNGYQEVIDFLDEPATFFPDIYDVGIDFLFWDGFSGFQGVDLQEYVGSIPMERKGDKELPAAVESGLFLEQQQWGLVKNSTFRSIDKFCSLNNKKTGQVWHKIVTAQEGVKSKGDGSGKFEETYAPLLQGAGGHMIGAAFDLIIRTDVDTTYEDKKPVEKFWYQIKGQNKKTKNRGFVLEHVMEADAAKLWTLISEQLGITRGAVDESKKE